MVLLIFCFLFSQHTFRVNINEKSQRNEIWNNWHDLQRKLIWLCSLSEQNLTNGLSNSQRLHMLIRIHACFKILRRKLIYIPLISQMLHQFGVVLLIIAQLKCTSFSNQTFCLFCLVLTLYMQRSFLHFISTELYLQSGLVLFTFLSPIHVCGQCLNFGYDDHIRSNQWDACNVKEISFVNVFKVCCNVSSPSLQK